MRTLAALAIIGAAIAPAPASAQKIPPVNLLQDRTPDASTVQRRRDVENDYNEQLKKIPDRKKSADPWQSVRPSDGGKPQGR